MVVTSRFSSPGRLGSKAPKTTKVLTLSGSLFLLAIILTAYTHKNPKIAAVGTALVGQVLQPAQDVHQFVRGGVSGIWDRYIALVNTEQENRSLRNRLQSLEARNSSLMELEHENRRLKDLLLVKEHTGFMGISANVIGFDPSNWNQSVTLDRGTDDGVAIGQAALVGDGIVGKIVSVSPGSSRLMLLTDPGSGIDAILQDTRIRGVVEGMGEFKVKWNYVLAQETVRSGDRIVSSGMDGIYPKGLLIGIVDTWEESKSGRLFKKITVKPAVNFSRLETVFVVTGLGVKVADPKAVEPQIAAKKAADRK